MTPDAILRLCTAVFGAPPAEAVLDLVATAAGDPDWTRSLVAGLHDEGRVAIDDGLAVSAGPAALPEATVALARTVLAGLSPGCRQLLCVAAVLGPAVDPDEVAGMTGSTVAALLPAWQEALDADLLRAGDGTLHFRHELLRRAVAASLPAALRNAMARPPEKAPEIPAMPVGRLTAREQTVMALVARGRSNQQIARSLDISSHSVKRHVSSLLVKLGCTNRTEVAILASDVLQPGQPGDRGCP
ncbi:helix-turn-helix transcriptional regulator [Paractinoplanes rishiriensis]|uniref:HTH luxR-type domain-containing protein n=1 Tax=Paractinoplanes rishiriensis TaxID=1050105 RepID=A0A919K2P7_9ACTN|nr:helix-turn-helix transcriptional regulator [Actinoplanes rishiriensis]GIE99781.1 hypothetical protein Ari01nite_72460 [Actinoplanes rishiriensis]